MHHLLLPFADRLGTDSVDELERFVTAAEMAISQVSHERREGELQEAATKTYATPEEYEREVGINVGDYKYGNREMALVLRHIPEAPFYQRAEEAAQHVDAELKGVHRTIGGIIRRLAEAGRITCCVCKESPAVPRFRSQNSRYVPHDLCELGSAWFREVTDYDQIAVCEVCAKAMCAPPSDAFRSDNDLSPHLVLGQYEEDRAILYLTRMLVRISRKLNTEEKS